MSKKAIASGPAIVSPAIISIGLMILGGFIAHGLLNFHQFNRYVSVKGLAEEQVKANNVIWTLNYSVTEPDLQALYQRINQNQQSIRRFMVENGIHKDAIYFGAISTNRLMQKSSDSDQEVNHKNRSFVQYSAYGTVTINSKDVDLVKALSQKTLDLVSKGVLINSSDTQYYFTGLNVIKPKMLKTATHNAKLAAYEFAQNAKADLGSLRQASQGAFTITNADRSYGSNDPHKIVRVVVNTQYFLR